MRYFHIVHQRMGNWQDAVGSSSASAFRQALDLDRVTRTASFVLPNQVVPITKIGVLEAGHSTSSERRAAMVEVPSKLRGATIVDLHGLKAKHIPRLRARAINAEIEPIEKLTTTNADKLVLIVPRKDLSLFLFQAKRDDPQACELSVTTRSDQGEVMRYCGSAEASYRELDPPGPAEAFLVIQPRYAP
jgi:hypothetical protein